MSVDNDNYTLPSQPVSSTLALKKTASNKRTLFYRTSDMIKYLFINISRHCWAEPWYYTVWEPDLSWSLIEFWWPLYNHFKNIKSIFETIKVVIENTDKRTFPLCYINLSSKKSLVTYICIELMKSNVKMLLKVSYKNIFHIKIFTAE